MTVEYSRIDGAPLDIFRMKHLQVQIWNILHEGPLNAWEIHRRLQGSDYSEIVSTLADMNRAGIIRASYSH